MTILNNKAKGSARINFKLHNSLRNFWFNRKKSNNDYITIMKAEVTFYINNKNLFIINFCNLFSGNGNFSFRSFLTSNSSIDTKQGKKLFIAQFMKMKTHTQTNWLLFLSTKSGNEISIRGRTKLYQTRRQFSSK